jgi:parallel beta-helix repeat protein
MRLSAALVAFALLVVLRPAYAVEYYVATWGNDGAAGTNINVPFKTITRAVDKAVAGDTVYVRAGTYREDVEMRTGGIAGKPIRVFAYGTEVPILKGSDVVTGWVQYSGSIWRKAGWGKNSQQVFVDFDARPAKSLQQIGMPAAHYGAWEYPSPVGSGVSTMVPGSFYYEPSSGSLYVWLPDGSSPNNHTMEVSVRQRLLHLAAPYVWVKGFAFRHSSTSTYAQQGAAVELSSFSTIENCDIAYMDFAGLAMGYKQNGSQAIHCNVSYNGNSGVNATMSTNFVVNGVSMNYNNSRNFNPLWHSGGLKAATDAYGTVHDSEAGFNNGPGIWFDYCDSGGQIVVRNNYVHDNGPKEAAIFFEASANALVTNNVLVNNKRRGIYVAASNRISLLNNTIVGTTERAAIEVAGMPRGTAALTDNLVQNNIMSGNGAQYDLYIQPDGTGIARNKSDNNLYYRSNNLVSLWKGKLYTDLASWRSGTQSDWASVKGYPQFTGGAGAKAYALAAGSPAIDVGAGVGSAVPDDYVHTKRPTGAKHDVGAFERPVQ